MHQDMRIDFQFDTAAFDFRALPFKIPYPVPFKLFGDETKARLENFQVTWALRGCMHMCLAFRYMHACSSV